MTLQAKLLGAAAGGRCDLRYIPVLRSRHCILHLRTAFVNTLSLRLASGGGRIDQHPAAVLVAAGYTLLQRSPPLVVALSAARAAIMLPPCPQWLVAFAACEGRSAVLLDPNLSRDAIAGTLAEERVGAVMTFAGLAARLPAGTTTVELDDAPRSARIRDGRAAERAAERVVDLGSHFGLAVEGSTEDAGLEEECLRSLADRDVMTAGPRTLSHRQAIADGAAVARARGYSAGSDVRAAWSWSGIDAVMNTLIAPLVAGAHVHTPSSPQR